MEEICSDEPAPDTETENDSLRVSREITRNISMKREGRSTFVTFNDFFTKDPLDNSIPVCTLRESISSEPLPDSPGSQRRSVLDSCTPDSTPRESVISETASDLPESLTADDTEQDHVDGEKDVPVISTEDQKDKRSFENPLTKNGVVPASSNFVQNGTDTTAHEENNFDPEKEVESGLENIEVLETTNDGHIWAAFRKEISEIDPHGKVIFKQELDVVLNDIAVLGSNSIFLVESQSKTIRFLKIEAGEPVISIFDVLSPDTPEKICINTKTREIVTTVVSNKGILFFKRARTSIKRYHYSGKCIDEISPKHDGKIVFDNSLDMVSNGNGDLCIVATKGPSHFVVVFDHSVNYRFLYHGEEGKQASFRPTSVCIDCDNNILSLDSNSRSIHIINQNGIFFKIFSPFIGGPGTPKLKAFCVYKEDKLLVGQDTGKIRVFKNPSLSDVTKL